MVKQQIQGMDIKYQFLGSVGGLLLILFLVTFPPKIILEFPLRKPIIGLIISVICILGIIAIFLPNKCAKFFYQKKDSYKIDLESSTSQNLSYKIRGHHPFCEVFSAHILQIKDKIYCSGCLGLLVGGLIALPMGFFYFFFDLFIYITAFFIVLLGIVFVLFGLFHFKFDRLFRFFFNTTFVLGSMFILMGIDDLIKSLFIDLLCICLIIFWLLTKIFFSKWDHEKICLKCENKKCQIKGKNKN